MYLHYTEVPLGEQFDVTVSIIYPLLKELNGAKFVIEGAGLGVPHKVSVSDKVGPGKEARVVVKMTAAKVEQKTISTKFYSKELTDVGGYLNMDVIDNTTVKKNNTKQFLVFFLFSKYTRPV